MATLLYTRTIEANKWASKAVCPLCSSVDCHRATRHGWRDFLHGLIGIFPWRCGVCRVRFFVRKRKPRLSRARAARATGLGPMDRFAGSIHICSYTVVKSVVKWMGK
jgi:hypothetical protein